MITAVTTCMGRKEHLETTLPMMLEEFEYVVVVDWSCPQKSGKWAAEQGAHVVYEPNQKYFNASKARNLGAHQVKTRSICFIDADTIVMPGIKSEIEDLLDLSSIVLASRTSQNTNIPGLEGFIAVDIGHFWGVKGYNESLEGYSLEDLYLRGQLCLERGLLPKRVSAGSLGAIRHDDELRSKFHKEPAHVTSRQNYAILQSYLKKHGIDDWVNDPRTSGMAFRE